MTLTPQPVIAFAMFPKSVPKQYANCYSGKFDSYMRQAGAILKAEGAVSNGRHAILRIGWEANIGSGSHPWGVDTTADATGYQKCFQRWVTVLRPILPGIMFEWTNAKVSHLPGPPSLTYPGDSYADLWGLHYYDAGGQFHTQALWSAYYNSTYKGGPQGLGTWLTAAAKAGKKLGVPEWGIRRPDERHQSGAVRRSLLHPADVQHLQDPHRDDLLRELLQLLPTAHHLPQHPVPEGEHRVPQAVVRWAVAHSAAGGLSARQQATTRRTILSPGPAACRPRLVRVGAPSPPRAGRCYQGLRQGPG